MSPYASTLDIASEAFSRNRADMFGLLDELQKIKERAAALSERRRPRFDERGQLTPRERLQRLLDPGMPFLELYALANYLLDTDDREASVPGASALSGIGFINGTRCVIFVDDSGIAAGAALAKTSDKIQACLDIAMKYKLPFVHLVESAGADLMKYAVESWAYAGRIFCKLANLSAAGIPTIAVLHGPATAGGAYMPGLSDYVISVKGRGRASLAAAALVRAATGEETDEEELAGTEMHATVSGLVEYTARDDAHALLIARDLVKRLDWNKNYAPETRRAFAAPLADPKDIAGLVPVDYRKAYDVREVIARVVDGSVFEDFKPRYGASTICVQSTIFGRACGIVGNNGPIDPDGATKAAQFFQLCDQADMPVIFLNNTTGYMVGRAYERGGMIKHGAKMIQAVANMRVPRITLYIGASFGAGNYGMSGVGFAPDFLFSWPNATTGVMGGQQAALTMDQVTRASAARRDAPVDEAVLSAQKDRLVAHFDGQSDAFHTSGKMLDQGIIDPRDTRRVLGFALETCVEARRRGVKPNSFGVARM
jgi:geranyl-CoA carboxylase beta subunit